MKLVVGLGNPGAKYERTKHNIGFMCLDFYANKRGLTFKMERKFHGEALKQGDLILLKPHTFMNLSGQSVRAVVDYYEIAIEDILVIYDDFVLPLGKIRLREQGGAGGHNGMQSTIDHLGTDTVKRLRFGIDSNPLMEARDYVLSKFGKAELDDILPSVKTVTEIIDAFIDGMTFSNIMNQFN